MATIATSPALPVPGRAVKVTFTLQESGANFFRASVTHAPPGSDLRGKLDKSRQRSVPVADGDGGETQPWETKFDRGGRYTFVVQEYTRGASGSRGYQGAPGNAPLETPLGSEYTLTLDIGQRMTQPVGTSVDTATLLLWVWDDKIRVTTLDTHGEVSPAIITAAVPTPKMAAAMESTAVIAAVAALATASGVLVSSARGDPSAIVADMVTNINAHQVIALGIHALGDGTNLIPAQYASTMAPADLPTFVNLTLRYLRQHRNNDDGNGPGSEVYHDPNLSSPKADFQFSPIIDAVAGLADAYAALAEIWRCHEGHRPMANEWHGNPTMPVAPFNLAALPLILQVHLRVFEVLASFSSAVPATQTAGAMLLIEGAGFAEG